MVSMTRYDPVREALTLRNAMDQLFSQSFVNPTWMGSSQSMAAPMDVCETDRGYEVNIALPGVKPEDIELTAQQNTLNVRGHYSYQNQHNNQHEGQQGQHKNWLMREMVTGTFERTITFPRPIDAEKVQTRYENGILTVTIPVSEASRPRRIAIGSGQTQARPAAVEAGKH
jgi:HSP20 family protein